MCKKEGVQKVLFLPFFDDLAKIGLRRKSLISHYCTFLIRNQPLFTIFSRFMT